MATVLTHPVRLTTPSDDMAAAEASIAAVPGPQRPGPAGRGPGYRGTVTSRRAGLVDVRAGLVVGAAAAAASVPAVHVALAIPPALSGILLAALLLAVAAQLTVKALRAGRARGA